MASKYEEWVHVKITDKELADQLDAMVEADHRDRSKFIRFLIEQEWRRRNGQAHWIGNPAEPLPIVVVKGSKVPA
jgi:metal-responsive CopG/Arc/MetJ family transcriptional regulator